MGKRGRRRAAESKGKTGMTVDEIKDAGYAVDLPFEAPQSAELRYKDGVSLTEAHPELLEGIPEVGGSGD